jgi:hypothetical protein
VSAAIAGEITAKLSADPATTACIADSQRRRLDSLMDFPLLADPTDKTDARPTTRPDASERNRLDFRLSRSNIRFVA